MADLKKCPFCGSDATFRHIFENPDKCMVGCRGCDVVIDGVFPNELEAAKKWNDQVLADEIAALRAELDALKADIEAGRLVRLNVEPEEDYDALKVKYRVFKVKDGTPVENCFVLRPEEDPAAFSALMAYAKNTENDALKDDLVNWGVAIIKREQEAARAALEGGNDEH